MALVHSVPPDGFTGIFPPISNSPSRNRATDSPARDTRRAASIEWNSVLLNGAYSSATWTCRAGSVIPAMRYDFSNERLSAYASACSAVGLLPMRSPIQYVSAEWPTPVIHTASRWLSWMKLSEANNMAAPPDDCGQQSSNLIGQEIRRDANTSSIDTIRRRCALGFSDAWRRFFTVTRAISSSVMP